MANDDRLTERRKIIESFFVPENAIEESEESVLEKITSGDWEDMNKSLGWIKLLDVLLDADELLEDLRKSF